VIQLRSERVPDCARRRCGNQPGSRLCGHERAIRLEHRCEPPAGGASASHLVGDEDRGERAHAEKKIVSRSPCRWMSKRKPPSSCSATRRVRSGSGSDESTGSAALACASSGKYVRVSWCLSRPRAKT